MTRQQMVTIILINALLSCVIATAVVLIFLNLGVSQTVSAPTPYVIVAASATPAPPPSATPTPLPRPSVDTEVYQVQSGDTLLGIALDLGIDLDTLRALNDLGNADQLFVGQELLVPLGSLPTATPTLTVEASPTVPTTPTPTATPTPVVIRALLASGDSSPAPSLAELLSPGVLEAEAVVLANNTDKPLSLFNWSLAAEDGRRYQFPRYTLAPGGSVTVRTRLGVDDVANLYWGQTEAAWTLPAVVLLVDPTGQSIATLSMRP